MASGSWIANASDNWSNSARWSGGIIADGVSDTATFSVNITATTTVTVDSNRTIGIISSSDLTTVSNFWSFASSGIAVLTLDNGASKPQLNHADGSILGTAYRAQYTTQIDGTNGFNINASGTSGNISIRGVEKLISGTVQITNGQLALGRLLIGDSAPDSTCNVLPNISSYTLSSINSVLTLSSNTSTTFPSVFTGSGNILVRTLPGITVSFVSGALSGLSNSSATYGAGTYSFDTTTASSLSVHEFASKTIIAFDGSVAGTGTINFISSSDLTTSTNIFLTQLGTASNNEAFLVNNTLSSKLVLTGNVDRSLASSSMRFYLSGSSEADNEISGIISNTVGQIELRKSGSGRWIVSGSNTYTGATTLNLGTLNIRNGSALGSAVATSATTLTSGTLQIQGGVTINKGSSVWALNGSIIENVSGDNAITAASWNIGTTQSIVVTAGSLEVTNAIAGNNTRTLTKSGYGSLYLSNTTNGYLGTVIVSSGELKVKKLANAGAASSLGTQAGPTVGPPATPDYALITMGGNTTLTHVGTTLDLTDRNIICNGASTTDLTIDSSGTGSGAITLSSSGSLSFSTSGTHTLWFIGNNSATNTCARTIGDATGGGAVSIKKAGGNTWSITGAITSTGLVTCSAGTLNFGATNRTFSGGLLVNSTNASPTQIFGVVTITTGNTISANTTMECGTITAVLTGANTLTVTSSAEEVRPALLQPDDSTNGNNTFTGDATINGCLDIVTPTSISPSTAGKGRVLGTSNTVTVSSTGIIRTKFTDTSNQRASARYNNLTFQSGSNLKIGYAN